MLAILISIFNHLCCIRIFEYGVSEIRRVFLLQGPISGYLSVLRTVISAFIASYELNDQVIQLPLCSANVGVIIDIF